MCAAQNLFDPELYRDVRLPFEQARSMPPWCYTSTAFFDREVDRIFRRVWNFAGRADEVPKPGDYLTLDMFGESIIIVRGRDHVVRAFANTCRHRGTRLLKGRGNCRVISCPYHSWAFALDGALLGAPDMDRTPGFRKEDYPLLTVHLEEWAGFLFVALSEDVPPIDDYLGNIREKFAPYRFEDMVCVRRRSYEIEGNWKLFVENAMEDYHTATVHRQSIGVQNTVQEDTTGEWDAIHMESDSTIAVLPEDDTTLPQIEGLTGRPANGTYFTVIYPQTFFGTTQDCMWWLQSLPHAPDRTTVVIGSCFPASTVARPDFEEQVDKYYRRWDKSLPEDNAITEEQHAGLRSAFARPGPLCWREPVVHALDNWVLDRVLD